MEAQNSRTNHGQRLSPTKSNAAASEPSAEQPSPEALATGKPLTEQDIVGLKYFDQLLPLLERLHHDGCQRDRAGNRDLHFDQYCLLVLVFLFPPDLFVVAGVAAGERMEERAAEAGLCAGGARVTVGGRGRLRSRAAVFDLERLASISNGWLQSRAAGRDHPGVERPVAVVASRCEGSRCGIGRRATEGPRGHADSGRCDADHRSSTCWAAAICRATTGTASRFKPTARSSRVW